MLLSPFHYSPFLNLESILMRDNNFDGEGNDDEGSYYSVSGLFCNLNSLYNS